MNPAYEGNEFEALKVRYEDQVKLLRFMTQIDLRIFSGYMTLQLALAAWLAANPPSGIFATIGILIVKVMVKLLLLRLV